METAQKRVIQINPDFFKLDSKPARKSRRSAAAATGTPRRKTAVRNSLKQQLLQKIRNKYHHDSGAAAGAEMTEDDMDEEDEFQKSLRFFENTIAAAAPPPPPATTHIPFPSPQQPTYRVAVPAAAAPHVPIKYTDQTYEPPPLSTAPNYGCLKNGELPTYRKWSLSQNPNTPSIPVATPAAIPNENGFYYTPPNINAAPPPPTPPPPHTQIHPMVAELAAARSAEMAAAATAAATAPTVLCKTTKRQFTVGKSKTHPRISVLLPNKTIRKRIMTETQKINTIPITKIKQYLQKHGLIKVGSTAPNHILRKMYESSMLMGGDIVNHNPDVLMYNFLRGGSTGENEPI